LVRIFDRIPLLYEVVDREQETFAFPPGHASRTVESHERNPRCTTE
jgi:hypothetical protein